MTIDVSPVAIRIDQLKPITKYKKIVAGVFFCPLRLMLFSELVVIEQVLLTLTTWCHGK